jgi:hypothetical protein
MEYFVNTLGIVTLGILSWQDFRSRRIAWWLLPILAGVFLFFALRKNSAEETSREFFLNLVFLVLQFLLVRIWFSIKNKKLSRIIDTQIGLGDVLFMICIALAFSPGNFLVFYTSGMILTLIVSIIVSAFRSQTRIEIPLAGTLALPLISLCFWRMFDPAQNFYSDDWLTQLFESNLY